jgi:penicillin-binding protein 1C
MKRAFAMIIIAASGALWFATNPARMPTLSETRSQWRPSDVQLLDRNGEPIHELRIDRHGRRLAWTAYKEISPALISAVVASEDHRFWSHRGVDLIALGVAAAHALAGSRRRGASTLTMQLASLLDLSMGRISARRNVFQKLRQILAAIAIERRWSKHEILEAYLNLVTYRGELQGIGAASRVMFGKLPQGLDASESIALAALIRAPNANRDAVLRRAETLSRIFRSDAPSKDAVVAAVEHAFASSPSAFARVTLAPHLAERMLRSDADAARCTLDRELQVFAGETLRRHVYEVRDHRVDDGALLVLENQTGEVWSYVGGAGDLSNAPLFDAVRAIRQPGSTLKPFLYAIAIDTHLLTAASLLEDTPLELPERRGIYRPLDYDRQFRGLVSMRTALASSLNVPAVRTADLVGLEVFTDYLRRLGFNGLDEEGDYYGAALALGSGDVSLWQLANAYRTLANGGKYSELRLTIGDNTQSNTQKVYSSEAAFVISDILADRASRSATFGLENSLATRYWSAVKTGTSKDMRDNWCVGYTDRFTVAVWVGNSSGAAMRDVTGITGAAPIWLDVMNYLHDRFGSGPVGRPRQVVAGEVSFPGAVEAPRREWFIGETAPNSRAADLDDRNPRIISPGPDTIVALDPDVPSGAQRIAFEASAAALNAHWLLDGRALGAVRGVHLWAPSPGVHTLALVSAAGVAFDTIGFSVRGAAARSFAADDRHDDQNDESRLQ